MVDSKENYKFHLRVKGLTTTKAAMFNKNCFILPLTMFSKVVLSSDFYRCIPNYSRARKA